MNEIKPYVPVITPNIPKVRNASEVSASGQKEKEKICKGFESFFIFNMLKEMEKSTHFEKKGYAEETYMSMVYEKVADFIADKGIGIKDMLMRYMSKENTKVVGESGDNVSR